MNLLLSPFSSISGQLKRLWLVMLEASKGEANPSLLILSTGSVWSWGKKLNLSPPHQILRRPDNWEKTFGTPPG